MCRQNSNYSACRWSVLRKDKDLCLFMMFQLTSCHPLDKHCFCNATLCYKWITLKLYETPFYFQVSNQTIFCVWSTFCLLPFLWKSDPRLLNVRFQTFPCDQSPVDFIKLIRGIWKRKLAGYSLLFLTHTENQKSFWGSQSTSEMKLLKIWETLVDHIEFFSVWDAFISPPHRQEQQENVAGHTEHVLYNCSWMRIIIQNGPEMKVCVRK